MEEVECRLVAVVDWLSCTLVRGVTCRVSGAVEAPGLTAPDVKSRAVVVARVRVVASPSFSRKRWRGLGSAP